MPVKLKGENQIRKFRRAAGDLVSRIASCEGVAGIVFLGALVRGFADRYSDLDITVLLSKRDEKLRMQIRKMASDEARRSGVDDVDLMIEFLEDLKKREWDETDKWDFSKAAKIVFDPKGEVKDVFREKLRVPNDFWVKRVVVCAERLKWYCCPPEEDWVLRRRRLGLSSTISESWIDRGDSVAAHYCLNYGVDLLLEALFALNREFLPVPKWRIFYSYGLKWLPEDYKELLKETMYTKSFSVKELNRRLKAIRKLWLKVILKIEDEIGLTPKQISEYYVHKILHQTWPPKVSINQRDSPPGACQTGRQIH